MTTPLNITSRNQGQIFGAKPSLEDFERQLEADPVMRAAHCLVTWTNAVAAVVRFPKASRSKSMPATILQLSARG